MKFTPNPRFVDELAAEAGMRTFVERVAAEVADEIEPRLPHPRILGGLKVRSGSKRTTRGWEGEARVEGPGWHLWEFGTTNHRARPAIRPGAQAALSRRGGRLGESR